MQSKSQLWWTLIVLNVMLVAGLVLIGTIQGMSVAEMVSDPAMLLRGFDIDVMPSRS